MYPAFFLYKIFTLKVLVRIDLYNALVVSLFMPYEI